jgi:hypothetical protein
VIVTAQIVIVAIVATATAQIVIVAIVG